jgi:hypothetical protein
VLLQQITSILLNLDREADLKNLKDQVSFKSEQYLLGVLTSLKEGTDCCEDERTYRARIIVIFKSFQQESHEVELEEFLQITLDLDILDNIADCKDGLVPHIMSWVSTGKHQVAHDLELCQGDGVSLRIGCDV